MHDTGVHLAPVLFENALQIGLLALLLGLLPPFALEQGSLLVLELPLHLAQDRGLIPPLEAIDDSWLAGALRLQQLHPWAGSALLPRPVLPEEASSTSRCGQAWTTAGADRQTPQLAHAR